MAVAVNQARPMRRSVEIPYSFNTFIPALTGHGPASDDWRGRLVLEAFGVSSVTG